VRRREEAETCMRIRCRSHAGGAQQVVIKFLFTAASDTRARVAAVTSWTSGSRPLGSPSWAEMG
jgi:hypothetical protein